MEITALIIAVIALIIAPFGPDIRAWFWLKWEELCFWWSCMKFQHYHLSRFLKEIDKLSQDEGLSPWLLRELFLAYPHFFDRSYDFISATDRDVDREDDWVYQHNRWADTNERNRVTGVVSNWANSHDHPKRGYSGWGPRHPMVVYLKQKGLSVFKEEVR